jgi:hypothetical protein
VPIYLTTPSVPMVFRDCGNRTPLAGRGMYTYNSPIEHPDRCRLARQ